MSVNLLGWETVTIRTLRAVRRPNTRNWDQIPNQKIAFTKPLMAIWLNNPNAQPNWYFGANATLFAQEITSVAIDKKRIALRENTLFIAETEAPNYVVDLWFPWWHSRIDLVAYQTDKPQDELSLSLEEILQIITDIASLL